ncbi:SDR family oxidoreductase, partial [Streptomyces sp. NPDC000941]
TAPSPDPAPDPAAWPPPGAVAVDVDALYERLAGEGYRYGPAFTGLRAAWRLGEEMYAEVALGPGERGDAARYSLHPALLDAALHPIGELFTGEDQAGGAPGTVRLPFSFGGLRVVAGGASRLRVRTTPTGTDSVTLRLSDEAGAEVATIESLTLRTVPAERWRSATATPGGPLPLYRLEWEPFALPAAPPEAGADVLLTGELPTAMRLTRHPGATGGLILLSVGTTDTTDTTEGDAEPPARVRAAAHGVLAPLREVLSDDADARLAVLTTGAVATGPGDAPPGLAGAAVWGLLRAAQAEHPDRIVLVDTDDTPASRAALPAAITAAEPHLALREGQAYAPRLVRAPLPEQTPPPPLDPEGTVLVTGGTGSLGRLVARHLAEAHGARHLLLVSRSGPAADGIEAFAAELAELGAEVRVASCDITDPEALAALLDAIPGAHPLTSVVHTAGVLDDGLVTSLTPGQLEAVLAPKVDAAWHLHRLTRDAGLASFVLFSSAASVLGNGGQGNYGAANAFLNALAERVRGDGTRAASLAWGLWGGGAGMTEHLATADLARMARSGTAAMPPEQGLALFDAALATGDAVLVPARFDLGVLREQAAAGT